MSHAELPANTYIKWITHYWQNELEKNTHMVLCESTTTLKNNDLRFFIINKTSN